VFATVELDCTTRVDGSIYYRKPQFTDGKFSGLSIMEAYCPATALQKALGKSSRFVPNNVDGSCSCEDSLVEAHYTLYYAPSTALISAVKARLVY